MNRPEIVDALRRLTHKQFVGVFYEAVQGRLICDGEETVEGRSMFNSVAGLGRNRRLATARPSGAPGASGLAGAASD